MARKLPIVIILLALLVVGFLFFPVPKMAHIQLPSERVSEVGAFPIVNSMIATWLTIVVLVVLSWIGTRRMQVVPGRLQGLVELVVDMLLGLAQNVAGPERGRRFFTIVTTIFLFVLVNNWLGLLPFFGSFGFWEAPHGGGEALFVPFLRSASTDLNTTLALALVSVGLTQIYGVQHLGFREYSAKFINLKGGMIGIFVGLLEGISEVAKIISFSFRLFGNIFAGEVLLATMAFLIPWVIAVPFMGLELFVGVIQALIFAMLTLIFMTTATTGHGHSEGHGAKQH